ncbi:hypothetical protein HO133_009347 [Letharia lupina]|uniref:Uncharacterized protein n=1 Tax=Letharia lupina TaxID=560253 RepID=A0A8H6CNJ6_9LECA|nr:uncharacterized protein HO133_009347 [Letharia lupina]KAF6226481.1 hypothetical protein HO133_009347 [Letharia lupina]
MCWPELAGRIEVEERRPRTWNEPRRKRLNFVRGHQRDSDQWVPTPGPRRPTEQEIWDRQRAREMDQRFVHPMPHPQLQGHHDPQITQMPHDPGPWHQIQPGHHVPQPGVDQHGHHGHQPQLNHRSHHSDDDIIAIEDSGDDGHDGHDDHRHLEPQIIHLKPPKSHLPKGLKAHAKKSGGHKQKYSISSSSSDDSRSSDGSSKFTAGFRAEHPFREEEVGVVSRMIASKI